MKVKLKTIMAGPNGCHSAGSIVDVPEGEARYLVETNQAEAVDAIKQKRGVAIETAENVPDGESASDGEAVFDNESDAGTDDTHDGEKPSKGGRKHNRRR